MLKIFIVLAIICIFINILNSMYISKCKNNYETYFHALMPTFITMSIAIFYFIIIFAFKADISTLMPINIIYAITIDIIFLIINSFIVVSNGIDRKKDNEVSMGLVFIFTLPIIIFISLPLLIVMYLLMKFNKHNNDGVKVVEEEIFDSLISANDYLK